MFQLIQAESHKLLDIQENRVMLRHATFVLYFELL